MTESTGKSILLVEDNLHNRRIFSGVLAYHGFVVHEATDGEEAIQKATELVPDLILMDLSLPVLDGWTATRRIKDIPALTKVPIIALTAHAMSGDEERARASGCDGYLSKPISLTSFLETVEKHLN